MHNLAVNLERSASIFPSKPALRWQDKQMSYQELNKMAGRVAFHLKQIGITQGDKVALSCPNTAEFVIAYYGILKAGGVVVPLNILFKAREVEYHLKDSDAKVFLCHQGDQTLPIAEFGKAGFDQAEKCEHFVLMNDVTSYTDTLFKRWLENDASESVEETQVVAGDDTAVILYTSGTTGQPKGAELSHTNMLTNAMSSQYLMRLEYSDTTLATLPLFHSFGQTVMMNASILTGATIVMIQRFDPLDVIEQIIEHKVSVFAGVPTMYMAILKAGQACQERSDKVKHSLRLGVSGGSSMPVETIRQFEKQFELPILEGYGLSETAPVATFNHIDGDRVAGSVGQPLCGDLVKVTDIEGNRVAVGELGEICIKSPSVMKGYYKRPQATQESIRDGWFLTGDVGRLDDHGNLFIVDRVKDMIIRGGYNVYPREVEEVLMCHPDVEMAAVVGALDDKLGEEVHAHVVVRELASVNAKEIQTWCRSQLADYKYPRHVYIRTVLPMTATGKILKRELSPTQGKEYINDAI